MSTRAGGGLDGGGLDSFLRVPVVPPLFSAAFRSLRRLLFLPRTILFFSVLLPGVPFFLILILNVPAVQWLDTTRVIWGCVKY